MRTDNVKIQLLATIIFFCCLGHLDTRAQISDKTPTEQVNADGASTQVRKYGDGENYAVSSGGDLSLSVPLMTVSGRKLSIPLKLNYQSGVKVDQKASDVGLGWGLSFGSITRDYGPYQPDYADKHRNETDGKNANGDQMQIQSSQQNPNFGFHNILTGFNGFSGNQFAADDYHVAIPGKMSNTFWNDGNGSERWRWENFSNWKIEFTLGDFMVTQEISRINEIYDDTFDESDQTGSWAAALGLLNIHEPQNSAPIHGVVRPVGTTTSTGSQTTNVQMLTSGLSGNNYEEQFAYQDIKTFTLIDEQGTRYVFGRALRAQKYIFEDDPFWSSASFSQSVSGSNAAKPIFDNSASQGEFWKMEYVSEWLLTAIESYDYYDTNNNGILDEMDEGDWIKIEYTDTLMRTIPHRIGHESWHNYNYAVPEHREWLNYSQTDVASSLWREKAYVTAITTPTQRLNVASSSRLEVDHDYFGKVANKNYKDVSWMNINHPNELKRYDNFELVNTQTLSNPIKPKSIVFFV